MFFSHFLFFPKSTQLDLPESELNVFVSFLFIKLQMGKEGQQLCEREVEHAKLSCGANVFPAVLS